MRLRLVKYSFRLAEQVLNNTWEGSLNFEQVIKYLPHFKSAIQVPFYVIGFDV